MEQEQILVTPEMAAHWLEKNHFNRPISPANVRYFSEQLRQGRAATTHQGIAINTEGNLQDGQNRLQAIIDTGISWTLWVATECPVENFHVIDVGKKRSLADFLHIRGYRNTKHLGAVGTLAWYWYRGRAKFSQGAVTDDQLVALLEMYPKLAEPPSVEKKELGIPKSLLSFLIYLDPPEDFRQDLLSETPDPTTNGGLLAHKYMDRVKNHQAPNKQAIITLFLKAANAHIAGTEPNTRKLRFIQGDGLPEPTWTVPIPFGAGRSEETEDEA